MSFNIHVVNVRTPQAAIVAMRSAAGAAHCPPLVMDMAEDAIGLLPELPEEADVGYDMLVAGHVSPTNDDASSFTISVGTRINNRIQMVEKAAATSPAGGQ